MSDAIPRLCIGGVPIARMTGRDLCATMLADVTAARAGQRRQPRLVTSANGMVVAKYNRSPEFRALLDAMDVIDADGMPLVAASRLFHRTPLTERVATTDWVLDACELAREHGLRFYFLGARPGVAARAALHLVSRYPGLQIAGVHNGYFRDEDLPAICARIVEVGTDVLWVGMGSPLQERFAVRARDLLPGVGWVRTCGGLFDHYGGGVSRAPDWMQSAGLEWLYRAAREPVRLGLRYVLTNPLALFDLLVRTRRDL
jgi:N-acetylglucosaminyldiphosphoundecaprenol N-acetyl-beta-D-mannosaminyltransferase